jgi:hypothetical protein
VAEIGMIGGMLAFLLPMIWVRRKKPSGWMVFPMFAFLFWIAQGGIALHERKI